MQTSARIAPAAAEASAPQALPALTPERVEALVAEANDAMLAENYDRSIQIYTRLLEEQGFSGRREARERLGIARERKASSRRRGTSTTSISPSSRTAPTRSACVSGSRGSSRPRPRALSESNGRRRRVDLGLLRRRRPVYRRDVYRPLDGLPVETLQSAFVSNVNLLVRRHGERFELASRVDANIATT